MPDHLIIFDTTLRDGEQSPGASMTREEKMRIAKQLERLKVDVIEAGFPASSNGDFEAVRAIASTIKDSRVCALARASETDIRRAGDALKGAASGRVHTFIASSPIHMQMKLRMTPEQVLEQAIKAVRWARDYTDDVEFSPEDAGRSEPDFLCRLLEAAITAGATTVNIPDTVGYAVPAQFGDLIKYLKSHVKRIDDAVISVHCHNDLGMAVANSIAAVQAGARQIEGTVNGIGERAGNAAIEEIVMAIRTRSDYFKDFHTEVNAREIVKSSRLVSRMCGLIVARSKAIVGENAFAHSSGIHQDGILKHRETYEIMDPRDVGWGETELPLTKHSGRHAMAKRLQHLGYQLSDGELAQIFVRFKEIGDKKKFVYDDDLGALVDDSIGLTQETWQLDYFNVTSGTATIPTATVRLRKGEETLQDSSPGNGAVDAAMKAIDRILVQRGHLVEYHVTAVSSGKDALGEVNLKCDFGGGRLITGKGASTDVIEASARAYLNAVNRILYKGQHTPEKEVEFLEAAGV